MAKEYDSNIVGWASFPNGTHFPIRKGETAKEAGKTALQSLKKGGKTCLKTNRKSITRSVS